jgi:hypothetical protein
MLDKDTALLKPVTVDAEDAEEEEDSGTETEPLIKCVPQRKLAMEYHGSTTSLPEGKQTCQRMVGGAV